MDIEHKRLVIDIVCAALASGVAPDVDALDGVVEKAKEIVSGLGAVPTEAKRKPVVAAVEKTDQAPAVPIDESVTDDFIYSLENGKAFKSLKRHLTNLGLTPNEYRAKWGLPKDYPMTSKNYSEARSEMALARGLGSRKAANKSVVEAA